MLITGLITECSTYFVSTTMVCTPWTRQPGRRRRGQVLILNNYRDRNTSTSQTDAVPTCLYYTQIYPSAAPPFPRETVQAWGSRYQHKHPLIRELNTALSHHRRCARSKSLGLSSPGDSWMIQSSVSSRSHGPGLSEQAPSRI